VNILFFIRLQDIEDLKVAAKKMLRQVVHSIYQALVVKATQVLKEIEVRIYYANCPKHAVHYLKFSLKR